MPAQINLLPKKDLDKTSYGKLLKFFLTYGRYIIVCTQLVVLLAFFGRFRLDREYTDLQDSITEKREIVLSLADFEQEIILVQNRVNAIGQIKQRQDLLKDSLSALKQVISPGNLLTNINYQGNQMGIVGTSETETSFSNLLWLANHSDYFSGVRINKISKLPDSELIEFDLALDFQRNAATPSADDKLKSS